MTNHVGEAFRGDAAVSKTAEPGSSPGTDARLKHANDLLFSRYASFIRREGIDESDPRKTSLRNLAWMCRTAIHEPMSTDKASRWLGFVQGCLAMRGIIDVDDERDYSRRLFHEAVGEQPTLEADHG